MEIETALPKAVRFGGVKRKVSLSALNCASVLHDPRVAHRTRKRPKLNLTLFPDDVLIKRENTVFIDGRTGRCVPGRVSYVFDG